MGHWGGDGGGGGRRKGNEEDAASSAPAAWMGSLGRRGPGDSLWSWEKVDPVTFPRIVCLLGQCSGVLNPLEEWNPWPPSWCDFGGVVGQRIGFCVSL